MAGKRQSNLINIVEKVSVHVIKFFFLLFSIEFTDNGITIVSRLSLYSIHGKSI